MQNNELYNLNTLRQIIAQQQVEEEPQPQQVTPPVVPSKDSLAKKLLRGAILALGAGLDIDSTNKAVKSPYIQESNSLIYGKEPSLGRLVGTKLAINLPIWMLTNHIAKKSPKQALLLSALSGGLQGATGVRNYNVLNTVNKQHKEQ